MTTPPAIIRAYPPAQLNRDEAIYLSGAKTESTLNLWIKRGWLPAGRKLGRALFWHRDDLMAALDKLHGFGAPLRDGGQTTRGKAIRKAKRAARRHDRDVA